MYNYKEGPEEGILRTSTPVFNVVPHLAYIAPAYFSYKKETKPGDDEGQNAILFF